MLICCAGVCQCDGGFSGADCSVNLSVPPTLLYIAGGPVCDTQQGPCGGELIIVGTGFTNSLVCVIESVQVSFICFFMTYYACEL